MAAIPEKIIKDLENIFNIITYFFRPQMWSNYIKFKYYGTTIVKGNSPKGNNSKKLVAYFFDVFLCVIYDYFKIKSLSVREFIQANLELVSKNM